MQVDADGAGFDPRRLEHVTAHVQGRYVDPGKIAGAQVLVARHGRVGYFRSFGSMGLGSPAPLRDDAIWRIYSMTKPVTSVALMQLYERGHFQLTDPVHRFIPSWRDLRVCEVAEDGSEHLAPLTRPVSMRDVLMHTAGLTYGGDPTHPVDRRYHAAGIVPGRRRGTLADFVDTLAGIPLKFQPGSRWHYSFATDVCGRLVEVLSGLSFDDYLREHVFGPLGMADTGFSLADDQLARLPVCYRRGAGKELEIADEVDTSRYRRAPTFLSGGGGLLSTSADYLRLCRMLLGGGELDGVRVLGRKTVELMTRNHLPGGGDLRQYALDSSGETGLDGVGFGLGFAVSLGPVATATVGSAGDYYWGGVASTIFWVDPVEDLVVIFMTQLIPSETYDFRGQLKALVYPAIAD